MHIFYQLQFHTNLGTSHSKNDFCSTCPSIPHMVAIPYLKLHLVQLSIPTGPNTPP